MRLLTLVILIISLPFYCFSQGGIDHIKNQSYMKHSDKNDCNDPDGDNLTSRICANLQYQKSDSLLVIVYKKLLSEQTTDSARKYIIDLQKDWRMFRDKHCSIVWSKESTGNVQAAAYLNCLTELTEHRKKELEGLLIGDR
jgi:uncharacterized protein YecT (DUF1311 family)